MATSSCTKQQLVHSAPQFSKPRAVNRRLSVRVSAVNNAETDRRNAMLALAATVGGIFNLPSAATAKTATRQAGDFCPPSATAGYVVYTPDLRATPALRAGVIAPNPQLYNFELPGTWQESTILNILSGNFCMPKCDEPWYESVWESPDEGSVTLVISPLYRLTSAKVTDVKGLGPPDRVLEQIGPFITGNYLDSVEDAVSMGTDTFADGKNYYVYELSAPYAKNGTHQLAALTVKGDLAYLFVAAGNDRQWSKGESKLRYMLKTFKA